MRGFSPGFRSPGLVLPMKRSALPNTHCGDDAFWPSTWVPTDAANVYAGPGEKPTVASFACSEDMKTFPACALVALPKPNLGALARLLLTWSPSIDRVPMDFMDSRRLAQRVLCGQEEAFLRRRVS